MIKQQHNRSSTPTPRRRTHLKPSQVAVLQESFVINSLPDSAIRSQLAHELGVSERTVQIWFQNRRAKARKLEAYTDSNGQIGSGGILIPNVRTGWVDIPPPSKPVSTLRHPSTSSSSPSITTFRPFMTPERFEETRSNNRQRSFSTHPSSSVINDHENKNDNNLFINDNSPLSTRAMSEGNHREVLHITLPTNALRIGTWARFASLTSQNELDLQCICFPFDRLFVWQIEDSGHQFRIQANMNHVHQIRLSPSSSSTSHCHQENNDSTIIGQLELEVSQVHFSMRQLHAHLHSNQWVPCGDFSENRQASLITTHILHGNYHALKQTFMDLMTMIPDLSSKFILSTTTTSSTSASASSLDLSHYNRDLTLSPSSTPEPTSSSSAPLLFHHLPSNSTSTISSIIPNTTSTATTSNDMKQSHSSSSSTSSTTSSSSLLDDQKQFTSPSSSSSLSCSSSSTSTATSPFMTTNNNNNQWINGMNSKFSTSSTSSPYDHFVPPPPSHPLPPPPSLDQMQHYYMQMFQHQPTSMFM